MKIINTDVGAFAVRLAGSGTPVVLLHCSGSSGNHWRHVADTLLADPPAAGPNQCRYHLVMPDLFGHGGSAPWPGGNPMRLADDATIVSSLGGFIGEPVHLVGHSYGGAVALVAALNRPEIIRSLTLIEPAAFFLLRNGEGSDRTFFKEICEVGVHIAEGLAAEDVRPSVEHFVDYWSGAGTWRSLAPLAQDSLLRRAAAISQNFTSTTSETATLQMVARLNTPTLLLHGSRTRPIARRIVERLTQMLPDAALNEIHGAGHMLPLTYPNPVARAIGNHVIGREDAAVRFGERPAA